MILALVAVGRLDSTEPPDVLTVGRDVEALGAPTRYFVDVALYPTSFSANPGGIMGLNRWGAPFTQISRARGPR